MIFSDFLFVGLNIGLGVLLAAMFVASNVYLPMIEKGGGSDDESVSEDEDEDEDEDVEEIYEEKYDEEYEKLEESELVEDELKELKNNSLIETTPMGDVLMFYDQDYEYFKYYSDKKEVSYKILETVAKKYVITNDCKQIYTDMNDEIMRQQEKNKGEAETSEAETSEAETSEAETGEAETGEPNEVSVFATLKTYNVKGNKGNDSQNVYIKEKINIYKYGGRIEEYTLIKNSAKDKVLRLDFASFKRMISGENENKKLV